MSTQYINEPITNGKVCLHTTAGDIEIELWSKETPLTCRNFVQLCMEGYYNGTHFHRLVKGFIIQGGDPTGTGHGGESIYGQTFKDEFHQRLKFNRRGLVGMANCGKNDNSSQFFFTLGEQGAPELNGKNTLFGKIVGPTLYNMLKMTEVDIKDEDTPVTKYKITHATIISNPFDDIVPREKKKSKSESEKKKKKPIETKKLGLLSFGMEAEEDEEELQLANKKFSKAKSAHDALNDAKLSKEAAVSKAELHGYIEEDSKADESTVSSVRERLEKRKRKRMENEDEEPVDDDLEKLIDEEKKEKERKEMEKMAEQLKHMQKEYVKALKGPKIKPKDDKEEEQSEAMQMYTSLKMKFKSKAKDNKGKELVRQKDPRREIQSIEMLEKFKKRFRASDQEAILFDRKVNIEDNEKKEEEQLGQMDLDAEDVSGLSWMANKFVAADVVDPNVTRAKDANMREDSEDWYSIYDPRNKINKRRRGEE